MGRKVAIPWHVLFSGGAGVLYFFFVLPRWPELMGDTAHSLGTALRIVAGALIALAALPVVFTLLRTRKPELGTPQLALTIRVASIVAHVLAGVLIIGTAISEIWVSLDVAGQWLFGIYGAAAAIGILGFFAFYLSFVAELPPPPPKPIKSKEAKKRRIRREKGSETGTETDDGAEEAEVDGAEEAEPEEVEETELIEAKSDEAKADEAQTVEAHAAKPEAEEAPETEESETAATAESAAEPESVTEKASEDPDEARARLRNRRPTGKGSHRMRRRRTRGGVALDDDALDQE